MTNLIKNSLSSSKRVGRPVFMEAVEPRRLMSVSVSSDVALSEISGTYWATTMVGDNGNPYGVPTGEAGQGTTLLAYSYSTLDSNLDDGLDSGWIGVSFAINASGNGSGNWGMSDSGTSAFSVGTGGLSQVTIQAAVAGAFMASEWQGLTVNFYHAGTLTESVTIGSLSANTMNASTNDSQQSIAVVTPGKPGTDGVVIFGQVRLQAAEGTYPGQTDVFSSIAIT